MKRTVIAALLLFAVFGFVGLGQTAEELDKVKEAGHTSGVYERAIQFFTEKIPGTFRERLANSHKYIEMVGSIFDEKGIPAEIAYLPLIESGFSPLSVSPKGAVGLWQFVRATAKRYGLRIDRYVDERKDPEKSTYAAANYLSDLYSMFGAWDIALAAYNAGEGRIRKIQDIYTSPHTPRVTRRYVPYFLAAATVALEPERYGFSPDTDIPSVAEDFFEITTDRATSLRVLAQQHDTTIRAIRALNPALLTDMTPPYPYTIRVPAAAL